jgi:predicted RNase H-like HicB family nuclease
VPKTYSSARIFEHGSQEEPIVLLNAIESPLNVFGIKPSSRLRKHFPDLESALVDNWTNALAENIRRSYERGEDIIELKSKVEDLSSGFDSLKEELHSCKKCVDELYEEFTSRPMIKATELFDISEDLEVIRPIPIVIEETEDEVVASFPEVEVFAVGTGEAEAINNLKQEIQELYYELADTPNENLGRVPQSWKRVLDKVLRKVGATERA